MKIQIDDIHQSGYQNQYHNEGDGDTADICYRVAGHRHNRVCKGNARLLGIGNAVVRQIFRHAFIEADRSEALIGIVVAQGTVLFQDIRKRKVRAAVTEPCQDLIRRRLGIDKPAYKRVQRRDDLTAVTNRQRICPHQGQDNRQKPGNASDQPSLKAAPDAQCQDNQQYDIQDQFDHLFTLSAVFKQFSDSTVIPDAVQIQPLRRHSRPGETPVSFFQKRRDLLREKFAVSGINHCSDHSPAHVI